ncbi:MAG: sigma-70 family RNA polymerase sigma factor [Planctomycetota bacterium]
MTDNEFEALVLDHHDAVYRSARRVAGDDGEAADVVQQVYLRVLEGKLSLPEGGGARRVLCWQAVRTALSHRRAGKRRRHREDRHAMKREPAQRPEEVAEAKEQRRKLWGIIESLPRDLRVPLVLRYHEEMTFGEIGSMLAIAENTAHDRVRKALSALQARVAGLGLAALAVGLEGHIAEAQPSGAAPALRQSLLSLPKRGLKIGLSAGAWVATVIVTGLLVVAGLELTFSPIEDAVLASTESTAPAGGGAAHEPSSTEAAIPVVEVVSAPEPETAEVQQEPKRSDVEKLHGLPPADHSGRVTGRVLLEGRGVSECTVTVVSLERAGKMNRYSAEGLTDDGGFFDIEVPVHGEGGRYRLVASHARLASWQAEARRVRPGEVTDFGDLEASVAPGESAVSWQTDLEVVSASGAPVIAAKVRVQRVLEREIPFEPSFTYWWTSEQFENESEAVTDQYGVAHLEGHWLGPKRLRIEPADSSLPQLVRRISIGQDLPASYPVQLSEPVAITGRVRALDGGAVVGTVQAVDEERISWHDVKIAEDGRFRLEGLRPTLYEVSVHATGLTEVERWVEAGAEPLDLTLKREEDPRDVGDHSGELHGRIVKAEDGSPYIMTEWFTVEHDRVRVPDGVDIASDLLPNLIYPRPVQRGVGFEPPPKTDQFHYTGLSAGDHLVRFGRHETAYSVAGPFRLGAEEIRSDIVIEAHPPGSISGEVRDAKGRRHEDALVFLTGIGPHSDRVIEEADTRNREHDGRGFLHINGSERRSRGGKYLCEHLPPGWPLRVVVVHRDHEPVIGPVIRLKPGESRRVDLELR